MPRHGVDCKSLTYEQYRRTPHVPLGVLDALCAAGLSDVPQERITPRQFAAAMERCKVRRGPGPWKDSRERQQERRAAYLLLKAGIEA